MAANRLQSVNDLDGQKFIKISEIDSYFTCNICMSTFDGAAITPCGHRFCLHCITNCLERSPECPNCKQYIQNNRVVLDRQHDALIVDIREKSTDVAPDLYTETPETTNQESVNPDVNDPPVPDPPGNYRVFFDHLNAKDQRLNDMTERLIAIKSEEVDRHKDEVRRLAIEFNNINTALQTANGEVRRLKDGLLKSTSDSNERITALEDTNDELQREKEALHDEIETLKKELEESSTNVMDLQDTNAALSEENDSNKNKLDALKQEQWTAMTDLNNKIETLEATNQQLDAENKKANDEVREYREALEKSNGDLRTYVLLYNALQAENKSINDEKQQLYQQVNDRFAQYMEELRQQVQFSANEIKTSLELEYEQRIKAAKESHNVNLLEKERQIDILKRQIQDQNHTADDLQQATRSYKKIIKDMADLKDQLNQTKREKAYFQEQLFCNRQRSQ